MEKYRRDALVAAFGNLPDSELRKLGAGLQAHHVGGLKTGQVVLLPSAIHENVHKLQTLAGGALIEGDTAKAQALAYAAQTLIKNYQVGATKL